MTDSNTKCLMQEKPKASQGRGSEARREKNERGKGKGAHLAKESLGRRKSKLQTEVLLQGWSEHLWGPWPGPHCARTPSREAGLLGKAHTGHTHSLPPRCPCGQTAAPCEPQIPGPGLTQSALGFRSLSCLPPRQGCWHSRDAEDKQQTLCPKLKRRWDDACLLCKQHMNRWRTNPSSRFMGLWLKSVETLTLF